MVFPIPIRLFLACYLRVASLAHTSLFHISISRSFTRSSQLLAHLLQQHPTTWDVRPISLEMGREVHFDLGQEVHFLRKCTFLSHFRSALPVPFQEVHFSSHFKKCTSGPISQEAKYCCTLLQVKSTKTRIELDPAAWWYYTKPFELYIHSECH